MRLALVTAWILGGAGVAGGLYWGFLNTPESTVWALALSATLLLLTLVAIGVTVNGAILLWTRGPSPATLILAGRRAPAILPAALIVIATWWLAVHAETWIALRSGAINAWFIARFGWDDVSWLFVAVRYVSIWVRWLLAGLLAIWLMASLLHGTKYRVSIRRVALASLWFVILIVVPWAYLVPWRPAGLPASSVEPVFIGAKLLIAAVVIACGAAWIVRAASPRGQAS
jgi:hypothetical protein